MSFSRFINGEVEPVLNDLCRPKRSNFFTFVKEVWNLTGVNVCLEETPSSSSTSPNSVIAHSIVQNNSAFQFRPYFDLLHNGSGGNKSNHYLVFPVPKPAQKSKEDWPIIYIVEPHVGMYMEAHKEFIPPDVAVLYPWNYEYGTEETGSDPKPVMVLKVRQFKAVCAPLYGPNARERWNVEMRLNRNLDRFIPILEHSSNLAKDIDHNLRCFARENGSAQFKNSSTMYVGSGVADPQIKQPLTTKKVVPDVKDVESDEEEWEAPLASPDVSTASEVRAFLSAKQIATKHSASSVENDTLGDVLEMDEPPFPSQVAMASDLQKAVDKAAQIEALDKRTPFAKKRKVLK
jgi:hypothetical protein